jgi:hypothetical protein
MADYASRLGRHADELAGQDPLPGRGVVVRELRAVPPPDGLDPMADTRLVALAAAVSEHAAASPRLELYPRELDLVKALRISQAAAGVRRESGIGVDDLIKRVHARFPEAILDRAITHVRMEDALKAAGFPLQYDPARKKFTPPALDSARMATSSSTSLTGRGTRSAAGLDPIEVLHLKLTRAVERGGFLALSLRGRNLPGAVRAISGNYPVVPVDLGRMFLTQLRSLANERGQEWDRLLGIEARFTETGHMAQGFASWIRKAWSRVESQLLDLAAGEHVVLFLHDAGLLARYWEQGGHDLLTRLQLAAGLPDRLPHGLWLLCPAESDVEHPRLDRQTVEVTDLSQSIVLRGDVLKQLREASTSAA